QEPGAWTRSRRSASRRTHRRPTRSHPRHLLHFPAALCLPGAAARDGPGQVSSSLFSFTIGADLELIEQSLTAKFCPAHGRDRELVANDGGGDLLVMIRRTTGNGIVSAIAPAAR